MSILKYWPLPIVGWLIFTLSMLTLAIASLVRSRMGTFQHWPYWLGAALLVAGSGLVSAWAYRPAFLTAPVPRPDAAAVEQFEAQVGELIRSGSTPGVAVVVVSDGEVVYQSAFGSANAAGDPLTTDHAVHWWSITKVITAVAVLQLAESEALNLDDPVSDHLDFFASVDQPEGQPITIGQLLSHSSGLGDAGLEILGWIHFDGDEPESQTLLTQEKLRQLGTIEAEAGSEGRYTNLGYMVLSAVVESVAEQRYEDYVQENILGPLGMDRSGFVYAERMGEEANGSHPIDVMTIAASLTIDMDRAVTARAGGFDWFARVYPDQAGPSGLIGTPSDMTKFMNAMLNGGELDGQRILSRESVEAMNRRVVEVTKSPAPVEGLGFGYAWFLDDTNGRISLTHGGQGTGTASLMRIYPDENLGITIVSNSTYLGKRFGLDEVELLANIDWEAGG